MAAKATERYLKRRGNKYQFRREIPKAIRWAFDGKTAVVRPLNTSDTRVAKLRRDALERETDKLFEEARGGVQGNAENRLQAAADSWAAELAAYQADPLAWSARMGAPVRREEDALDPRDMIEAEAEEIGRREGEGAKARFLDRLHGRASVNEHLEAYLAELDLKPKTKQGRRADVKLFAEWAADRRLTLRQIDRRRASEFFEKVLLPRDRKTAETKLSNLKVYWRWLIERGHYEEDSPWERLRFPALRRGRAARREEAERPFTAEEMKSLFGKLEEARSRNVDRMRDAMTVAALSGMRLDEICSLTVGDCDGGTFTIREGKTDAAARTLPIHSSLTEIIERRSRGKAEGERLFADVAGRGPSLSDPLSKQFGRYIRDVKIADLREGHRRSKVNFHSFRRRFVQEALRADHPPHIVSWIVGHAEGRQGITLGVYDKKGPSLEQMKRCVEAVGLE
jgi:integrase